MAPIERRSKRPVPGRGVLGLPAQERQALLQSGQHVGRGERRDAGGGELKGKRQSVETDTQLGNDRRVVMREREVVPYRPRPRHEQRDSLDVAQLGGVGRPGRIGELEWGYQENLLPPEAERLARGHQEREQRTGGQEPRDLGSRRQHPLETVEDDQHRLLEQPSDQVVGLHVLTDEVETE